MGIIIFNGNIILPVLVISELYFEEFSDTGKISSQIVTMKNRQPKEVKKEQNT